MISVIPVLCGTRKDDVSSKNNADHRFWETVKWQQDAGGVQRWGRKRSHLEGEMADRRSTFPQTPGNELDLTQAHRRRGGVLFAPERKDAPEG